MNKKYLLPAILGTAFQLACSQSLLAQTELNQIAFLSDIHLQDVYADLGSEEFRGVLNSKNGKFTTIRTMNSQLNSTRLFNENYFAFISALENLKKKGIQLVVLPGDFTDDGQPMNVLALKKILDQYSEESGMRFFLTTGNHDPVKPYGGIAGKKDFLGVDGSGQAVAGTSDLYKNTDAAISDQINYWGYPEITVSLAAYGFFPSQQDIFWSHPFKELNYDSYDFDQAKASSTLENRVYPAGETGLFLPDASYVVEPVDGIWLLALDGNVYTHTGEDNWNGSSVGFNQAAIHKSHQLDWIKKVAAEAEKRGKSLISFSHYPLVDFHDGASEEMKSLFGSQKFQLLRVPTTETSELYATAGIRIHFAGHMHINDTGLYQNHPTDNTMYNIQVPSLAAFPPAYKTLKTNNSGRFEVETTILTEVDHMNEFFDLYRMEHRWLLENQKPGIWDSTILASKDYFEYTRNHLLELTRSRFLSSDWPENLVRLLSAMNQDELIQWGKMSSEESVQFLEERIENTDLSSIESAKIIDDFYLLKNGDEIGKRLIPEDRITFYQELLSIISQKPASLESNLNAELLQFFGIFSKLFHSHPSDHFRIDLKKNTIERID